MEMEYNSAREHLIMPEYGRNVQKLVQFAKTVKDPLERLNVVEQIIDLMFQMNPHSKNLENYKEKLWKHLFRIAEYDLDIVPPNGNVPTHDEHLKKPDPVTYPVLETKYRHYGHNIQVLIKKALLVEDPDKKLELGKIIASYMKLAYRTWNKEHFVSDENVKADLKIMSDGKLSVEEGTSLDKTFSSGPILQNIHSTAPSHHQKKRKRPGGGGGYSNHNKSKSKFKNRPQ
jgi:hypothetical protein